MKNYFDKKILIIKEENDPFEKFWSFHMRRKNIDVVVPYKNAGKIMHFVRAICKRTKNHVLHGMWLGTWKMNIKKYDNIIVFDNCATEELLKWINEEVPKEKITLWLWNIPSKKIDRMEKYANIACFDEEYCKKQGYKFIHQFYFENIKIKQDKQIYDFVYVGSNKNRFTILNDLADYATTSKLNFKICLYDPFCDTVKTTKTGIVRINRKLSYEELLGLIAQSKAIVEINSQFQRGLTLRALEALFLKRKLITNNKYITKFDFYDSNNIYILQNETKDLKIFLDSEYEEIENKIKDNYSYEDWIKKRVS